jgi:CDP-2,3-bis-(O-geranylgeranyl)-sn-glycerol synthase
MTLWPVETVVVAIWAMLPAYVPNNVAVLGGGGPPIDGGRTWRGRRLLGEGKTWRGTAVGVGSGAVLAVALTAIQPAVGAATGISVPRFPLVPAVALPAGAMAGDIVASFLKRRTGRERGRPLPVVDQLDFVVGAIALTAAGASGWFAEVFLRPPTVVGVVVVVTPALHLGTNLLAYRLGLNSEPY